MTDEIKIRFTVESKETETRFSCGHYLVPVSKIPDFLSQLGPKDKVFTSEVVTDV